MTHRLIFVEDDAAQLELFKDALKDWNAAHAEKSFELETATTFDASQTILSRERFDGALLDLRLPGASGGELPGKVLADLCVSQYGIPAAIISGNPADYETTASNGMLAVFDKGDSDAYQKAVNWFGELWHMMKVMSGTRKRIQQLGASVFSKQVWPRWNSYEELFGINDEQLIGIVTRQYTSHIAEILGIDTEESVTWHPFESYIQPAIQESRANTGDLFQLDGKLWIVLTPQCDMATRKAKTVLLAGCEPDPEISKWRSQLEVLESKSASGNQRKAATDFLLRLINQNSPAKHFLPPLVDGQPLMIDFKNLRVLPLEELQSKLAARVASVAAPFLGNLVQRFGAYISRVGQPTIDIRHLS
jgi:CheY-like chemotaxis protein